MYYINVSYQWRIHRRGKKESQRGPAPVSTFFLRLFFKHSKVPQNPFEYNIVVLKMTNFFSVLRTTSEPIYSEFLFFLKHFSFDDFGIWAIIVDTHDEIILGKSTVDSRKNNLTWFVFSLLNILFCSIKKSLYNIAIEIFFLIFL